MKKIKLPPSMLGSASVLLLFLFFFFHSCQEQEQIKIRTDQNGYPVIEFTNAFGDDIVLAAPSSDTGSIGLEISGQVCWTKGVPVEIHSGQAVSAYAWDLNGQDSLIMTIESDNNAYRVKITSSPGKSTSTFINIKSSNQEYFTGVLERVVDGHQNRSWEDGITTALDLRGERVGVRLKPTVSAYAPFYITSGNYSFFAQGTWPGMIDFCREYENFVLVAFEGPGLVFSLQTASTPVELVRIHALETGPSVVPPLWALGPWRWRDEHFNNKTYFDGSPVTAPYNSDLVEDVMLMEHFDIPCTAFWIDRPWGPGDRGFKDYEFDPGRFPKMQEMISWLNGKKIELMIWIAPFVMGEQADYVEKQGWYLESRVWMDARQLLMDFSNPEAVRWWGENGPGKLARMGIKGFKLDRADGEKLLDSLHLFNHAGITYRENFNDYARQYVKAAYDAVQPVLGDNFILYPRAQYTGSARYGAMWAGDTDGKAEGLRSVVIGVQRCAIMGYPLCASDIGGYWGQFNRETCMRWLGFGCFCPIMETGPTLNRGFWNMVEEPSPDTELIAIWRLYSVIRMKLIPYLHSLAVEAHETGTPVVRPLFLEYPEQEEAWKDWQTYLLGSDLLVSIIWEKGKTEQNIYLPRGETWIDAWNPEMEIRGGQYITVQAPLHQTPVFIRKGSELVDLGDLNALWEESLEKARQPFSLSELEQQEKW